MDTSTVVSRIDSLQTPAPASDVLRLCNQLIAGDFLREFDGSIAWEIDFPDVDIIHEGRSESLDMAMADIQQLIQFSMPTPNTLVAVTFQADEVRA